MTCINDLLKNRNLDNLAMSLLRLLNEILSYIVEAVSDGGNEADGDILSLAATCHLMLSLSKSQRKQYLQLQRQYSDIVVHARSGLMLGLLVDLACGSNAPWHVRSLRLENMAREYSTQEQLSGGLRTQTRKKLKKIQQLLSRGRPWTHDDLMQLWYYRIRSGNEWPLLALLVRRLPSLQSVRPIIDIDSSIATIVKSEINLPAIGAPLPNRL